MKIAFVSEHFNPACGGQETYMNDFTEFLLSEGHEVHFYTQDAHEDKGNLYFHQVRTSGILSNLRFYNGSFLRKRQSVRQISKALI